MRVPNYMLYLRYGIIHNYGMINECPDGKGVLVDYQSRNIIYLSHRKGQLVDKRMEEENVILNKVFELDNIDILIGTEHANSAIHTSNAVEFSPVLLVQKQTRLCQFF